MTALILLPGMDGTGEMFADFVSALGEDVSPVVVRYPEKQPLDYDALADFVRTRLPTDRPFILLGESFSGPLAISLAALRPVGLIGLILCCSFARNPVPLPRPLKALTSLVPINGRTVGIIAPLLFGRFSSSKLRATVRQAIDRVSPDTLRGRLRSVLDVNFSAKLKDVSVPTLYLQATEDRVVPATAARYIAKLKPTVQIVRVKAPHLLLQAVPTEAATIVKNFVQEIAMTFNTAVNKDAQQAESLLPKR